VNARKAADAVAFAATADGHSSLSFGYDEIASGGYQETRTFQIYNHSNKSITYSLSSAFNGRRYGATLTLNKTSVTVPAKGSRSISATLRLSATAVANLPDALVAVEFSTFGWPYQPVPTVRGVIKAKPSEAGVGRYPLRVPFLAVPRGVSNVGVVNAGPYSTTGGQASFSATLENSGDTGHIGYADIYAWGLADANEGHESSDIAAVGVQSFTCDDETFGCLPDDRLVRFAVNTWGRWSNMSTEEFDVLIDVDGDDAPDFAVFSTDAGLLFGGVFDGTGMVITCSLDSTGLCETGPDGFLDGFFVDAPPNGSTAWLPTLASDLGLSSAAGAFRYTAAAFNVMPNGGAVVDSVTDGGNTAWAPWNPWLPAVSQGDFYPLLPGQSTSHTFGVSLADAQPPNAPLGWMVVAIDDRNGGAQADLVPLGTLPPP
ncbi:MAG TPA: hypothetical protein VK992_06300, partial [Candidatus Caenarcaniphilales bacterium]|nr:hypothetical protein [Candidatus Caenarcaniphilales bacterium]